MKKKERLRKNLQEIKKLRANPEQKKTLSFKSSRLDYLKRESRQIVRDSLSAQQQKEFSGVLEKILKGEDVDVGSFIDVLEVNEIAKDDSKPVRLPSLPQPIEREIRLDAAEIDKCIEHGCFRSASVLCGRILEAALHRKYYDVTGNDILETQPGIGLGKLIAKLKEKDIDFPPGITEQIHLINQVRINSVHKKASGFVPSLEQAQAMRLYTLDILRKLF